MSYACLLYTSLSTVTGETYYDGFLAAIIGWRSDHETAFEQRYHIVFEINNDWYKVYAGNYSDDLVSFLGLLDFMNLFNSAKEMCIRDRKPV